MNITKVAVSLYKQFNERYINSGALAVLVVLCFEHARMHVTKSNCFHGLFQRYVLVRVCCSNHNIIYYVYRVLLMPNHQSMCELDCDCGCNLLLLHVQPRGGMHVT